MGKVNENDILLDKLVRLEMEEKSLIRNLNMYYCDTNIKNRLFAKLKKVKKEINAIKFKIRLEREIRKNDRNNDTSES